MFKTWLENKLDAELRQEAQSIANTIISVLDDASIDAKGNTKNHSNRGIEQNSQLMMDRDRKYYRQGAKHEYLIGEFLPKYPNLKLKFINQPGFGKNKSSLGEFQGKNVIAIAIPKRTLDSGNALTYPIISNGIHPGPSDKLRFRVPAAVVNYLKKPGVYNTLVHEVIHFLDGMRTKSKVFKNYPYGDDGERYYNHPSEYNANLQAFLSQLDKSKATLQSTIALVKGQNWFQQMTNDNLRRNVIKRIASYFSE